MVGQRGGGRGPHHGECESRRPAAPFGGQVAKAGTIMEAAKFHWDIENDRLYWKPGAHEALGLPEDADIGSIGALMLYVDATHSNLRHEIVFDPANAERREYAIGYRLLPDGRNGERGYMVYEHGRWLLNPEGEPAHVFGEIRRMGCDAETGACDVPMLPDQVDPSSGLHCRGYFMKRVEAFLRHGARENRNAALIILTLKNYPIIFDTYGFKVADAAFVEVGRRLKSVMRAGDVLARYGDKRLAMLIHDCDEEDLGPAMTRFLEAPCREPVQTDMGPVWPMLALGTTIIPRDARTLSEAIAFAEEALAEAELQPGNAGKLYNIASSRASHRAMKAHFANEVFTALREKAFTLAYQPIVRAHDGDVIYHEALLHIIDKNGETVSAGHLIPVAEELGLIRLVDLEVLDLALQALREQPDGKLGINVSATTVMDAQAFLEKLVPHADLVRDRLVVEITESSMLSDPARVAHFIDELHKLGCKVALDDFGAGYTSFKNLRDYHFDIVKLDGAFCENLAANEQNQHFMRSLINLARNTNMVIIAEWVEREEDAELLRNWGVDGLQGFLFGAAEFNGVPWPAMCRKKVVDERPVLPVRDRVGGDVGADGAVAARATGSDSAASDAVLAQGVSASSSEEDATHGSSAVMEEVPPPADKARGEAICLAPEARCESLEDTVACQKEDGESTDAVMEKKPADKPVGVRELMRELEDELASLREMMLKLRENAHEGAPASMAAAQAAKPGEEASGVA